jgi:hypothetical protein
VGRDGHKAEGKEGRSAGGQEIKKPAQVHLRIKKRLHVPHVIFMSTCQIINRQFVKIFFCPQNICSSKKISTEERDKPKKKRKYIAKKCPILYNPKKAPRGQILL